MVTLKDWPASEQPREKLIHFGAKYLSSAELLAIFFRTGVKGKTALDLAREALQHFGGLRNLLSAKLSDFCVIPGLGEAKYTQLQAMLELHRRYLFEKIQTQSYLTNVRETREYLQSSLGNNSREVFACLFLTKKFQVINFIELFYGNIHQADVYLGEVVKAALQNNAAAVIIAHNHPSNDPEPSQADIELTQALQQVLHLVDIQLIDHVILTKNQSLSLAEKGYLHNIKIP